LKAKSTLAEISCALSTLTHALQATRSGRKPSINVKQADRSGENA